MPWDWNQFQGSGYLSMRTLRDAPSPLVAKLARGRAPTYFGVEIKAFSFCILVEIAARCYFFSSADSAKLPLRDQSRAGNIFRAQPCKTIRTCPFDSPTDARNREALALVRRSGHFWPERRAEWRSSFLIAYLHEAEP